MSCHIATSTAATQYASALAQNAAEVEALPGLRADGSQSIKSLSIRSRENLAWQIELLDETGNILSSHAFATTDATVKTISEVPYYFYTYTPPEEWCVPHTKDYQTDIAVRNLSAESKTAGSDGELVLYIKYCA
jgi:hypothetical protein